MEELSTQRLCTKVREGTHHDRSSATGWNIKGIESIIISVAWQLAAPWTLPERIESIRSRRKGIGPEEG